MATLLDLADRGVVAIRELPRHFGVRNFELSQVPGRHELSGHEAAAVSIAFADAGDPVTLAKARARLARRGRQFSAAVVAELTAMGMLDEPRTVAASRLKMVGLTLLIGGAMLVIPAVMLVNVYGQWPLMIPLAIGLGGFAAIIAGATMVVLSETGLIRAARWRGYRRSLKNIAADREPEHVAFEPSRALIYAVALGLAAQWSRYLKRRPAAVPPWFASIPRIRPTRRRLSRGSSLPVDRTAAGPRARARPAVAPPARRERGYSDVDERRSRPPARGHGASCSLEALGSVPQRAAVGNRARGLQRRRHRLGIFPARSGAFARLSLERGRAWRHLRSASAASALPSHSGTDGIRSSRSACSA